MKKFITFLPFILCFLILASSSSFSTFTYRNALFQLVLFLGVACIPAFFSKKMSYVDVAWPWGLVLIGLQTFYFGEGLFLRKVIISSLYILAGLRMGIMALPMLKPGLLKKDLPRYQYQRIRWEREGYKNTMIHMQIEILMQGVANVTFLALPAMLQGFNPEAPLSILEISGYILWGLSFFMESLADYQKNAFIKQARLNNERGKLCQVGLWKYSRHPNYFAEWMLWNGLILSSIPSLFALYTKESFVIWGGILLALFFISRIMYTTLVYYSGAKPSEYYSLQKRPEYKTYQMTTNMFFPGPRKDIQ